MGRSGRRKQQRQEQVHQQQRGAGRKSCQVSAMLDVCHTCLKGEEWCFTVGEVGHVAPDQPPPWQVREEPEHPAPMWEEDGPEQEPEDEGSVRPQPKRGEAERLQPKALLAGEEYLLVSPPPPPSKGKEQELPLHPPRRTGPLSSEGIWDWLAEPETDIMDALPAVINLLCQSRILTELMQYKNLQLSVLRGRVYRGEYGESEERETTFKNNC
ncbi:UNVERIFIED_CONTAM: hypothetical protein FKN15_011742 [Acipenser sinensis]